MDPGSNYSLDCFSHWTNDALCDFLSKRGLSKEGTKQELMALCFAARKINLPILPTASEIIKINKQQYEDLLKVDSCLLPDPLQLHSGWHDETSGISYWPPIYLSDISSFLIAYENIDTVKKHLWDYKVGKAYNYFQNEWLKEVFYYDVQKTDCCFLRARCIPSQTLNNEPHTVWVCAQKVTGKIKSAYCTCTAGLGQTCNHVAGLLFRVEAANKLGVTACTSVPCTWNMPQSDSANMRPIKLVDLDIKKSRHGKSAKSRPLAAAKKKSYTPLSDMPSSKEILNKFATELRDVLPNACFYSGLEIIDKPDKTTHRSLELDASFEIKNMVKKSIRVNWIFKSKHHPGTFAKTYTTGYCRYQHGDHRTKLEPSLAQDEGGPYHIIKLLPSIHQSFKFVNESRL